MENAEKTGMTAKKKRDIRGYVYAYSVFGDLICAWWSYLFLVMLDDLLHVGNSMAVLSYIIWLVMLGPGTLIYAAAGVFLSKKEKSEKAKKILTVSAALEIFFLVVPVVIYFITAIKPA